MNNKTFQLAEYSLYAVCFFVFFSTALTAIFSVLMILFWLGSGTYKNIPTIIKEYPVVIVSISFFALFIIGVFYTPAPLENALDFLKKYRVLIYIPIVMSLYREDNRIGRNIINSFFIGYLALLVNAYLVHFGLIPMNKFSIFRHGGGFLVIFAYLTIHRILTDDKGRLMWMGFFAVICYDLFFILNTRTGWILFLALSFLFFVQYFSLKKQVLLSLSLVLACVLIYQFSSTFNKEIHKTITSLKNYDISAQNSATDLGVRLDWYQNSIELIKAKPLFGYGTGAFFNAQSEIIKNKDTIPATDPHNEFFLIGVQIGLIGVVFFMLILVEPIIHSFRLIKAEYRSQAYALQAVVIFLAVGCLFNSWLLTSIPSHIFAILLAVFYSLPSRCNKTPKKHNLVPDPLPQS